MAWQMSWLGRGLANGSAWLGYGLAMARPRLLGHGNGQFMARPWLDAASVADLRFKGSPVHGCMGHGLAMVCQAGAWTSCGENRQRSNGPSKRLQTANGQAWQNGAHQEIELIKITFLLFFKYIRSMIYLPW